MGHGYRWWYRMTGVPGWVRFGVSRDWQWYNFHDFRPYAQPVMYRTWSPLRKDYLRDALPSAQVNSYPMPEFLSQYDLYGAVQITPEQAHIYLRKQAELLEDELVAIREQMKQLEHDSNRR